MVSLNHLHGRSSGIFLSVLTKVLNEVLPNVGNSGIRAELLQNKRQVTQSVDSIVALKQGATYTRNAIALIIAPRELQG